MKRNFFSRILSLALILAIALPIVPALADDIYTDGPVTVYSTPDTSTPLGTMTIDFSASPQNGWYMVPNFTGNGQSGTMCWVPASSVKIRGVDPTASPSPSPSPVPTTAPTLAPGETATPVPSATAGPTATAAISGEKDTTYTGVVLKFTVPAGGLWVYDKPGQGASAVESIAANTVLTLTEVSPSLHMDSLSWYSLYYNGTTYYVPDNSLKYNDAAVTGTNIKSVRIGADGAEYFTQYNPTKTTATEILPPASSAGVLAPGTIVNVTYVAADVYSFVNNGKTYYFRSGSALAGSELTAEVVGNDSVTLMTKITIPSTLTVTLYRDPKNKTGDYLVLNSDPASAKAYTLYAETYESVWYKVVYQNEYFYIEKAELSANGATTEQVANNDTTAETATFWVTVGSEGALLYSLPDAKAPTANVLQAGAKILVAKYNSAWYTYSYQVGVAKVTYFIYYAALNTSGETPTTSLSSYKVLLDWSTQLYSRTDASTPVSSVSLPQVSSSVANAGYYVVYAVDEDWFSITVKGTTYYIKTSAVLVHQPDGKLEPIATVTTGKTYTVTLSKAVALYRDEACTTPTSIVYHAGQTLQASKYTDALYTVNVNGETYFLPVEAIATVGTGDDGTGPSGNASNSISDIITGVTDESYTGEVLVYTVPSTGLWLYYSTDTTTYPDPALTLSAGGTVRLTPYSADWYTTWYNSKQYYVNLNTILVRNEELDTSKFFSVQLLRETILYTDAACTKAANMSLGTSARVNVKVVSWLTLAEKQALGTALVPDTAQQLVNVYSTIKPGTTSELVYFKAFNISGGVMSAITFQAGHIGATVASSAETNLVTRIDLSKSGYVNLYPKMEDTSGAVRLETPATLYGVPVKDKWYKVIYDSEAMYLDLSQVNTGDFSATEISVAGDVTSDTYTIVIGEGGALLYLQASTATTARYMDGANQLFLAAGTIVQATSHGNGWYSTVYASTNRTVYFQNAGGNATTNASVRSYIIDVTSKEIYTYSTITTSTVIELNNPRLEVGKTYTLRTVNSSWSSVTLNGKTYYVKNADIDEATLAKSTPIGSTTIGKTYVITIGSRDGSAVNVYPDSQLKGTARATLPYGHKTSGTKMYVENAANKSEGGLVYKITHDGATGYIDAKHVIGVVEGDEVDEAKAAAEEEANNETNTGETVTRTLLAGTNLYTQMNTSTTPTSLTTATTVSLKKESDTWYSTTLNEKVYYVLATVVESSETEKNEGSKYTVGNTFVLTLTKATNAYAAMSKTATVVAVIPVQMVELTKVAINWYSMAHTSGTVYLCGDDIFASTSGSTTDTNKTHDENGVIITAKLEINVTQGTVNLRKTASQTATIMERIPKGTTVPNNGYERDAGGNLWYKTTYQGTNGFVLGTFVLPVGTVSSSGSTVDPSSDIGRTLYVDTTTVNIRSGAGTKYTIIGRLDRDAAVVPLAYTTGDDGMLWYEFKFSSSQNGFIRYDYVRGGVASSAELEGNVAIKSGGTNLRSGAGDAFPVVAKLERDTIVTIIGSGTDGNNLLWYRVTLDGMTGYIRHDLVRQLTIAESESLYEEVLGNYTELKYGSTGAAVLALQQQLINIGYLASGNADGTYGVKTTDAVTAFQKANGLSQTGIATPATQAAIFNTTVISSGSTSALDWFTTGKDLLAANKNIQIYDIKSGVTWNALYVEGGNHADVVPATAADAQKLKAGNVTGSYVRRPVIVTIGGAKYAGSMYAVGHGSENFVSFFSGVMCLHFTGSKTHGSGNVDADHQTAIQEALEYAILYGN